LVGFGFLAGARLAIAALSYLLPVGHSAESDRGRPAISTKPAWVAERTASGTEARPLMSHIGPQPSVAFFLPPRILTYNRQM
jgi:hypothetical protein